MSCSPGALCDLLGEAVQPTLAASLTPVSAGRAAFELAGRLSGSASPTAGASPINPLVVLGLMALAAYVYSCWRNPYTERKCPWCQGKTRRHGWVFPAWRDRRKCWWCRSESKRRRWGAMLIGRG